MGRYGRKAGPYYQLSLASSFWPNLSEVIFLEAFLGTLWGMFLKRVARFLNLHPLAGFMA